MPRPPDRNKPPGPGDAGPIEPNSVLHRLLVLVAEAIVRARSQGPPPTTDLGTTELPPPDDRSGGAIRSPDRPPGS